MVLAPNEVRLLRKPPPKYVGRDKRAAEILVMKGALLPNHDGGYDITKAGQQALVAAAPKKGT